MKILKLLMLLFIFSSCQKKEVLLPKLGDKGATEVYNTSKIWIFFNVIKGDTTGSFNKNNKIANTNLIFNVDKRLPIKEVFPKIQKLIDGALNAKVHRTIDKNFYLSYADTVTGTFALYDITNTRYVSDKEKYKGYLKKIKKEKNPIFINIKKNSILLNGIKTDHLNDSLQDLFIGDTLHKNTLLLQFDQNISYLKYLTIRSGFFHDGYVIENIEYIYNEE